LIAYYITHNKLLQVLNSNTNINATILIELTVTVISVWLRQRLLLHGLQSSPFHFIQSLLGDKTRVGSRIRARFRVHVWV
jgi:hypothetical protein